MPRIDFGVPAVIGPDSTLPGVTGGAAWTMFRWTVSLPADVVGRTLRMVLDDTWSDKGTPSLPGSDSSIGATSNSVFGHDNVGEELWFSYSSWLSWVDGIHVEGGANVDPWVAGEPRAVTFPVFDDAGLGYPPEPSFASDYVTITVKGNYTTTAAFTMPYYEEADELTGLALPKRVGALPA